MSRAIGGKDKRTVVLRSNLQPHERQATDKTVRDEFGRFLPGHPGLNGAGRKTAREWKLALEERSLGRAIAVLDAALDCPDPRVALDAAKEIKNTVWGKPTEKVQTEQLPVTYQAMSDDQFQTLAGRIQGDGARGPNGESGADPDGDGVSHTPDATEAA